MRVTYQPEGERPQTWEFNPDRVRASDAELIEKRYGDKWDVWRSDVISGGMRARRVLLWHLLRIGPHGHPLLRYEDTPNFYTGELKVEYSSAELRQVIDRVGKMKLDDAQREQIMAALDVELREAYEREGKIYEGEVAEEPGKSEEVSQTGSSSTGSTRRITSTSGRASSNN